MTKIQPPRMVSRPSSRAPKQEEPKKDLLETSKVSPMDKPLYHGTTHIFGEGEVLRPKDAINARFKKAPLRSLYGADVPPRVRTTDYVYSTSDLGIAKNYAMQAAQSRGMKYAPVYEVAPTGDVHSLHKLLRSQDPKGPRFPEELLKTHENSYISDKEMVPRNVVTWVENPEGKNVPKEFDAMVRAVSAMAGGPTPDYKTKSQRISEQFANVSIPTVYRKQ